MARGRGKTYNIADARGKRRWYFYIFVFGQRVRKGSWDTKAEAETALEEFEGRLRKTNGELPRDIGFSDLCDRYVKWAEVNLSPRTRAEREITIRAHLKPFLDCTAREVSFEVVEAYKQKRTKDRIAPSTMNTELKALSCILRYGVDCGYIENLPRIRRVKAPKKNPRYLSEEGISGSRSAASYSNSR